MSIGTAIVAALDSLVDGRVYAAAFPQEPNAPTWPAIRFSETGRTVHPDACGSDAADTDDVQVQVDVVALDADDASAITLDVIAAMVGLDPPAQRTGGLGPIYDDDARAYRCVLLYEFQPSSG